MKRIPGFLLFSLIFCLSTGPVAQAKTAPIVYGIASIVPGLGQAVNGRPLEGLGYFAVTVGGILIQNPLLNQIGLQTYLYQYYDAWRDGGGKPSEDRSWWVNYLGTINPLNAIDWVGTPMLLLVAVAKPGDTPVHANLLESFAFGTTAGWGEEFFFRGFLFPVLSFGGDTFWLKLLGATTSSAIFSFINRGIGTFTLIEFAQGMLFCLQTDINDYNIRKSAFTHAWWNILADVKSGAKLSGASSAKIGITYNLGF